MNYSWEPPCRDEEGFEGTEVEEQKQGNNTLFMSSEMQNLLTSAGLKWPIGCF